MQNELTKNTEIVNKKPYLAPEIHVLADAQNTELGGAGANDGSGLS